MKIFTWAVAVLLILGALIGAGFWLKGSGAKVDEALPVRVETVNRGELIEVVQAPAEIQPLNKVSISAKVSSRIVELPFKEGDKVKKGDILVKLDATDLEAQLRSAEARYAAQGAGIQVAESRIDGQKAQLQGQRATLTEAERDFERQKNLLASHDVSQATVDTAQRRVEELRATLDSATFNLHAEETNLKVLRHNLDAAEAEISRAKEDLSYTTIASPIDGILTTLNAKVGELVMTGTMNNAGTVILEVADLSQMLAQARVDETDIGSVEVGQPTKVHLLAYPDEVFNGKVTAVGLARMTDRAGGGGGGGGAAGDARTFKVEVLLDVQSRRIHSGLTADVEIQTKRNENIIKVPTQAVMGRSPDMLPSAIRDDNPNVDKKKTVAMVVFRLVEGKAVVTPVTAAAADNSDTMIVSGLKDGDRVITGPYKVLESLAHDQKVKEEAGPATKPTTMATTKQG